MQHTTAKKAVVAIHAHLTRVGRALKRSLAKFRRAFKSMLKAARKLVRSSLHQVHTAKRSATVEAIVTQLRTALVKTLRAHKQAANQGLTGAKALDTVSVAGLSATQAAVKSQQSTLVKAAMAVETAHNALIMAVQAGDAAGIQAARVALKTDFDDFKHASRCDPIPFPFFNVSSFLFLLFIVCFDVGLSPAGKRRRPSRWSPTLNHW